LTANKGPSSIEEPTYSKVDKFYKRIKDKPYAFLKELISLIYGELYEFDDSKIKSISKSLAKTSLAWMCLPA
jgi:hypothetical protein